MSETPHGEVTPAEKPQETRIRYHKDIDELQSDLLRLGAMVCETVPRGTDVLLNGDLSEAQRLIADDGVIDQLALDIEERAYTIIARQAPMAGDLRRLITITKMVAELERSSDLMVNVTKAARRMYGAPMTPEIRGVAAQMAKEAHRLLRLSIDAFADDDEALAGALDDIDDQLDQLNIDMVEAIFSGQHDSNIDLQAAVQLALVARYYERIGDHAVNIGQRVTYMITGGLPDLTGAVRADRQAHSSDDADSTPSHE